MELLIIGVDQTGHIGRYLVSAAKQLDLKFRILDSSDANARSRIGRSISWHVLGKKPARLRQFGRQVLDLCARERPRIVLTTGHAPLNRSHIEGLRDLGIRILNYSTDDPWNPALRAPWFLKAIPLYDAVFTTRRANIKEFQDCGVSSVHYLPFGYDPDIHRPWPDESPTVAPTDVLFVGGCDADRFPLIGALIDAGLDVALFGGYWDRHLKTRPYSRGMADQNTIRSASATARISLCLVRRANRDSHVMRSYEAAAIGGCMLVEDTVDHRELFGPDNHAVCYFKTTVEMVQQAKILVADAKMRNRLSLELTKIFAPGGQTYVDRLSEILRLSNARG